MRLQPVILALLVLLVACAVATIGVLRAAGPEAGKDTDSVSAFVSGSTPRPLPEPEPYSADDLETIIEAAAALDPLSSLLIWHRDSLLVEEYLNGMSATSVANVKSVSKSIVGLLVGIAIEDGVIDSLDQPIADLLPAYAGVLSSSATDAAVKRTITVRDLLTMQSGLESTSSRNYGAWVGSSDWVRDALRRPVECAPGTCWGYSTGTTHVLGVIVAQRTGRSLRDYASDRLFGPLGIPVRAWDRDPQGNYLGGNNMSFRPAELIRLGRLLLNDGEIDGRRLVPSDWLDVSWRRYARSPYNGNGYGFHWWNRPMRGEHVVFAWGYGGQFLYIVPRLDLAVVVTSTLANRRTRGHNWRVHELLEDEILPVIRRRHNTPGADG